MTLNNLESESDLKLKMRFPWKNTISLTSQIKMQLKYCLLEIK